MNNKQKLKTFMINDTDIIEHSDAHIGTCIELASWLGLSVSTLNTNVKNCEEI
jgi:hypothetical protein